MSDSHDEHSGKKLGWFLCWAVVFADIGTSLYYVPGILFGEVGKLAGLFVMMSFFVFIFLVIKYIEITDRYPEGGGVVTVASHAFNPWIGALGGMFIIVDYFLTAAISSVSGFAYLNSVVHIGELIIVFAALSVIALGILNAIGISESAKVTAGVAIAAFLIDIVLVISVATQVGPDGWRAVFDSFGEVKTLGTGAILAGFAGSFLAFSGLESISQLSPAMETPRRKVAGKAMIFVVIAILFTSPLLTLFSTNLLTAKFPNSEEEILESINLKHERKDDLAHLEEAESESDKALAMKKLEVEYLEIVKEDSSLKPYYYKSIEIIEDKSLNTDARYTELTEHLDEQIHLATEYSERFMSELGSQYSGTALKIAIVATATILLVFAANTAIIGSYHVFIALAKQHFLPQFLVKRNKKFGTPHWSILLAVLPPVLIIMLSQGDVSLLGELYAFGLLGAFTLSSIGLDVVRWKEKKKITPSFLMGVLTSVLIVIAWSTNLINKERATIFGLSITIFGMLVALYVRKTTNEELVDKTAKADAKALNLTQLESLDKSIATMLVPVYDEFDKSFLEYVSKMATKQSQQIVLLYIREFYDVLASTNETIESDAEAREFIKNAEAILAKGNAKYNVVYESTGDLSGTVNAYRDELKPEITVLSPHKTSALFDFLHGDVIKRIIEHSNGNVLIYTGSKK